MFSYRSGLSLPRYFLPLLLLLPIACNLKRSNKDAPPQSSTPGNQNLGVLGTTSIESSTNPTLYAENKSPSASESDALLPTGQRIAGADADADVPAGTSATSSGAGESKSDLYTLSRSELLKVPASVFEPELIKLRQLCAQKLEDYLRTLALNKRLCEEFPRIKKQCPAMHFISSVSQATDLECQNTADATEAPAEIQVELQNATPFNFRLKIDEQYYSDEFSTGTSTIQIARKDGQTDIKPPRFREIKSISLMSVKQNSQIVNAYIRELTEITNPQDLVKKIKFRLLVGGVPIAQSSKQKDGWLDLNYDPKIKTELNVPPEPILTIGKGDNCYMTPTQLAEITKNISSNPKSREAKDYCHYPKTSSRQTQKE
ncbi:MAG: hypothetical protein KA436_01860 [Oligoflexales bacterium]|nr:hypothetical protein [Oligoflexales bacterium]